MKLTHLGHSCLLVEAADQRVLIDPGTFSEVGDVRGLTAVLVTHQHPDHVDPGAVPDLLRANPDATLFVEPEAADLLTGEGIACERLRGDEERELGSLRVRTVGDLHAQIHPYIDRIHNLGLVLSADGEPTLFHPGDAVDAEPGPVDVLAVPVNAPWCAVKETVEFCRRIGAERLVPIHDGLLKDAGRRTYLTHIGGYGRDGGAEVVDLAEGGAARL